MVISYIEFAVAREVLSIVVGFIVKLVVTAHGQHDHWGRNGRDERWRIAPAGDGYGIKPMSQQYT